MTSLRVTRSLPAATDAWVEVIAHPELLFGPFSPDLLPGRSYQVTSHFGSGSEGRIESVGSGMLTYTWGQPTWPSPGRLVLTVGEQFVIEATGIPEPELNASRTYWERIADGAVDYLNSSNPPLGAPVAAVLFDADGVLQAPRDGWLDRFVRVGGHTLMADAFAAELECLAGGQDLAPKLQSLLDESGTGGTVDQVWQVWHDIVIDPDAVAVVAKVREAGLIVALATNQQSYRGANMRDVLDLDRHFDHTFYSHEVGHAKPSVDYFRHIVAELAVPADRLAFIDDSPANVTGARAVGVRAALHRSSGGAAGLADDLRSLGVPL